jgi:hypothetical protein
LRLPGCSGCPVPVRRCSQRACWTRPAAGACWWQAWWVVVANLGWVVGLSRSLWDRGVLFQRGLLAGVPVRVVGGRSALRFLSRCFPRWSASAGALSWGVVGFGLVVQAHVVEGGFGDAFGVVEDRGEGGCALVEVRRVAGQRAHPVSFEVQGCFQVGESSAISRFGVSGGDSR